MKLDILAFGSHPDDVELSCSGTLLRQVSLGNKVGIIDLTQGELGTRGSADLRLKEAAKAAKIIGSQIRDNLKMSDGFFLNDKEHQLQVITKIRQYRPEIVLCNAIRDRHPDHSKGAHLVADSCFLSGLTKIETKLNGKKQDVWRPKVVYNYIQYWSIEPSFIIDISKFMDKKMLTIKAFSSQFHDPTSKEPMTLIAQPNFLEEVKHRAEDLGRIIGVKYAEGFVAHRYIGVKNLFDLV